MGNYMETCIQRNPTEEENQQQEHEEKQQQGAEKTSGTFSKESCTMRVKLVLTKDELGWLLVQLKKDQVRKVEELLGEIEKSRKTGQIVAKWKPCLESIMESPEVHPQMDRHHGEITV